MRILRIISLFIQVIFIVVFLVTVGDEFAFSVLLLYLFLGPAQLLSHFVFLILGQNSPLRKIYTKGVIVFFIGTFLYYLFLVGRGLYALEILFWLSTTLLALFYLYISITEVIENPRTNI